MLLKSVYMPIFFKLLQVLRKLEMCIYKRTCYQVWQFAKFMISNESCIHIHNLSRPGKILPT